MQEILKRLRIIKLCLHSNNNIVMNLQIESIRKYLIDDELQQILNDTINNSNSNIISRIDTYISDNQNSKITFELNESASGIIENSNYSIKLKDLKNLTFEKIRRLSMNYIDDQENSDKNNHNLYEYMDEYGKRDKALLYSSYDVALEELIGKSIHIIDWGSEQSIASTILLDYIREKQLDINVEQITLISEVKNKLSRGILHCNILQNNTEKIIGINKNLKFISDDDLNINNGIISINLLYDISMPHLISYGSMKNTYFIVLGTMKNDNNIDRFMQGYANNPHFKIISNRNNKIGRFQRKETIFSV